MKRRDFLKAGAAGISSLSLIEPGAALAQTVCTATPATTPNEPQIHIRLSIMDVRVMMIDGKYVNMLGYRAEGRNICRTNANDPQALCGAVVPGPVLRVLEGWRVRITIENMRPESHGFEITGVPESKTEIAGKGTATVEFTAPPTGTYIYHDNLGNQGLYRILGLAGVFIVQPAYCNDGTVVDNPYGNRATPAIKTLFQALADPSSIGDAAVTERFRPGRWVPTVDLNLEFSRQEKVWAMSQVDPRFNNLIQTTGIRSSSSLTNAIRDSFVPRYFMMNGRSGFDLSSGEDVVCRNYIGEPTLLRTVNLGMAHHSNHIHGNHLMELTESALVNETGTTNGRFGYIRAINSNECFLRENILERDVWPMYPMQRKDLILPYEVPPDIPEGQFEAMVQRGITIEDAAGRVGPNEPFPLRYVMHCHCEMSQTAAGGNYPQGLVTHWEIEGGYGQRPSETASL